jgi:hypothetical protein
VYFDNIGGWAAVNTIISLLMIFVVLPLRASITKLTDSDEKLSQEIREETKALNTRVGALEVDVAKNYVQRQEVVQVMTEISVKLDRISSRFDDKIEALDHAKADK